MKKGNQKLAKVESTTSNNKKPSYCKAVKSKAVKASQKLAKSVSRSENKCFQVLF